ncbi:MAG: heavy-metal-associated domain-containing protein [Lachnospiraceae bacterium]|jgi:copper ion binding protein|nr:heavy-metal-associated domain-containing protein [Lachnospiraceae bacterium]
MENVIIIGIVVILILIGIRSGIKHFKGEGGCCGGGSTVKPKKKRLKNVVVQKTVIIEGMTCEHCKNRVERCINDIDGVAGKVNLKKKQAIVSFEKDIEVEQIRTAIEKAGYKVIEIQ